jgi:hypothetical protein
MNKRFALWPVNIWGNFCIVAVLIFGGFFNASNFPNVEAFAVLKADGSIVAWGQSGWGGIGAPSDNGYTKIYSTASAFAALKAALPEGVVPP